MNTLQNLNIIKGLKLGNKQEVGIMTVYPLIGEDCEVELATFDDIKFSGTTNYGCMEFINKSDKPFILPTCYSILTKQKAQDHAITFATLLNPNKKTKISNACCVQQTQCGFIDGDKLKENFGFLPLHIRKNYYKELLHTRISPRMDFSRLWTHIISFQKELLNERTGNLIYFFTKFIDKLNGFNAEFELVDEQRGAIVLINNKIVGIEICPSHNYFKKIWHELIRECYGSEVVRMTQLNLKNEFLEFNESRIDLSSCLSIEDIENAINNHHLKEENTLLTLLDKERVLKPFNNDNFSKTNSSNDLTYGIYKVNENEAVVELYTDSNENIIYLSLVSIK